MEGGMAEQPPPWDQQPAYALPLPLPPAESAPPLGLPEQDQFRWQPAPEQLPPPAAPAPAPAPAHADADADAVQPATASPGAAIDLTFDSSEDEGTASGWEEDDELEVVGVVPAAPRQQQQQQYQYQPPAQQQQQHATAAAPIHHGVQHHDSQQRYQQYQLHYQQQQMQQQQQQYPQQAMTPAQRLQLQEALWAQELQARQQRALELQAQQQPRPAAAAFVNQPGPADAFMQLDPLPRVLAEENERRRQLQLGQPQQQMQNPLAWIQPRQQPVPTVGGTFPYSAGEANRAAALAAAATAPGLTSAAYLPYGTGAQPNGGDNSKKRPNGGDGGGGSGYTRQYSERVSRYVEELGPSIHFAVSSGGEFCAKIIGQVPESVVSSFRLTPGARCRRKKRRWYFPLAAHNTLKAALGRVRDQLYRDTGVILSLSTIPDAVLRQLSIQRATSGAEVNDAQKEAHEKLAPLLPARLLGALAPFQKEGAAFVVGRGGRGLIADEMGLGKTIQAIAVAAAYRSEWPMLVLCPSSARFHWEAELLKWLDADVLPRPGGVQVVTDGKKAIDDAARVVILSYDLALRFRDALKLKRKNMATGEVHTRFRVVVADECHYLKNAGAQRTKELLPLLAAARRAVLLSGTPALSRPRELWTQVHCLDQEAWKNRDTFLERYCTGSGSGGATRRRKGWGGRGQGAANLRELHELLKATVMVRRRKADIVSALPPKRRVFRRVEVPDPGMRAQLQAALRDLRVATKRTQRLAGEGGAGGGARKRARRKPDNVFAELERQHQEQGGGGEGSGDEEDDEEDENEEEYAAAAASYGGAAGGGAGEGAGPATAQEAQRERKMLLMEVFKLTGQAKIPLAVARIEELLGAEHAGKMLVFAHHRSVLDAIEAASLRGVPHIRIDGGTAPRERQAQVELFQSDPSVRVALLSLTAAGLALTLTAASRVLFVELFWTPGALLQAEDRCHRIGQTAEVEIEYLLAQGTLDDALWPLVRRKMRVLGELVEGAEGMDMEGRDDGDGGDGEGDEGKGMRGRRSRSGSRSRGKRSAPSSGGGDADDDDGDGSVSTASTGSCESCQGHGAAEGGGGGGGASFGHGKGQGQGHHPHRKQGSGAASLGMEALLEEPDGRRSRMLLHQLAREARDRPLGGEGEGNGEGEDEEGEEDEDYLSSGMSSDDLSSSGEDDVVEVVALSDDDEEEDGEDRKLAAPAAQAMASGVSSYAAGSGGGAGGYDDGDEVIIVE